MSAQPSGQTSRDAAAWNSIHLRYWADLLNGAGYTRSVDRNLALGIWNASGRRAQFNAGAETIARHCGKSPAWVDKHMAGFLRRQAARGNAMFARTLKGKGGPHIPEGQATASEWDVSLCIDFVNRVHAVRPFTREDHERIGQDIAAELRESTKARDLLRLAPKPKATDDDAKESRPLASPEDYAAGAGTRVVDTVSERASLFGYDPGRELHALECALEPLLARREQLSREAAEWEASERAKWHTLSNPEPAEKGEHVHELWTCSEAEPVQITGSAFDPDEAELPEEGAIKGEGERHEEAAQANVLFDSVGATEAFCVWIADRDKLPRRKANVDLLEFERQLPEYQAYADGPNPSGEGLSFAYRPHGPNVMFVQADDIRTQEALEASRPYSFGQFETSPGSYQAWVAVAGDFTDAERTHLAKRFLAWLKTFDEGANPGAHGSIRFPGFLNFKYSNPPMVETIYSQPGLVWTVADLEAAGVLPDLGPLPGGPSRGSGSSPLPLDGSSSHRPETLPCARLWPSYERALSSAAVHPPEHPTRPGLVNRSSADMSFCNWAAKWGWGWADLAAQMHEVSENWRDRDEDYRAKTLSKAFALYRS